jgi:hypothetical protein
VRVLCESVGGTPGTDGFWTRSLIDGLVIGCLPVFASWQLPPLYSSGVRWQLAPDHGTGNEDLQPPPIVYQRGWGDCGNLTLWRLLELNCTRWEPVVRRTRKRAELAGIRWTSPPARAVVEWTGDDMHAYLRLPNGDFEDPSEILGMPR